MFAFIKSIVRLTLNIRRCAIALEKISTLYELQMNQQGIIILDPKLKDETEVSYPKRDFDEEDIFEETNY